MATAEQQARWRARDRMRQQGLEEVRGIWLRPADHDTIREAAEKLREEREDDQQATPRQK